MAASQDSSVTIGATGRRTIQFWAELPVRRRANRKVPMTTASLFLLLAFLTSSCARAYRPVIDPAMIRDPAKYERDLAECEAVASQQSRSERVAAGAVGGTIWGALFGALFGWIVGGHAGTGAAAGGLVGGASGAAGGAEAAARDYETIYRNCMIGRGWPVLR